MNANLIRTLRPNQEIIIQYQAGLMGISAVPGSGKTWTLSLLAADLLNRGILADDQEILVVTLVNSAVDNFYQRVGGFIHQMGLLPHLGYRVRTLHGLAHDIIRERPGLVGLPQSFSIIDERQAEIIRKDISQSWLKGHLDFFYSYLAPTIDERQFDWLAREKLADFVQEIGFAFIRRAKDLRLTPDEIGIMLNRENIPIPLVEMGHALYTDYQRSLAYREAVDFDDLVRLAIEALESDPQYLERLRYRWPYILEDEAQDSSQLQERILSMLAGDPGNWVRVGDPNQAIYETFTTANPRYLRQFLAREDVQRQELPNSGRSTISIINLANHLVEWTMTSHPNEQVRDALSAPPLIQPTPEGDPQPNPTALSGQIRVVARKFTPQEEVRAVADSIAKWLADAPTDTLAVLVPLNRRGDDIVDELRARKIDVVDSLLRSSSTTRFSAGVMGNLLNYLADPQSSRKLAKVYQVWQRAARQDAESWKNVEATSELIRKLEHSEDFLWPLPGMDWLDRLVERNIPEDTLESLSRFRLLVRRWQASILLPIDQVVLTIAQDLLTEPVELAIAHKLALLLRDASRINPDWRLPELTEELGVIARNERRMVGLSPDDLGFDPEKYPGKVVVATIHKAKGLEWDRVYLMSVNNYDFPSGMSYDSFISEKWFIRDRLNLQAEALAQLEGLFDSDEYSWYVEGEPTNHSRRDYIRERLRLLYVGITRAKKELIITWNTGQKGNLQPASALLELISYQEKVAPIEG